jgi:antirestriction factor ArdC-like protein
MAKAFDKQAWLEAKEAKLEGAKRALEEGLKNLQSSDDWRRMLESMAHAGATSTNRYSFANQLLIQCRRPGTAHAATFKTWLDHGRHVKKGESGMPILAPVFAKRGSSDASGSTVAGEDAGSKLIGFRVLTVFSLEQTEGEPLPEPPRFDFTADEAFEGSIEKLTQVALALPDSPVSRVTLRERRDGDHSTALGWYELNTRAIVVISTERSRAQQFKTLVHECTHGLLHPLGNAHERPVQEVEAESVAFVVCHALGLDSSGYSFPYVAGWAQGDDALKLVAESGERIAKTARKLLDALVPAPAEAEAEAA